MSKPGEIGDGPHFILSADGEVYGEDNPTNREVVRRIHACVNACEGISTEELENGLIGDMRRALDQVVPLLQDRNTVLSQIAAEVRATGRNGDPVPESR